MSLRFWMCFPAKYHIHLTSSVVFSCCMLFLIPVNPQHEGQRWAPSQVHLSSLVSWFHAHIYSNISCYWMVGFLQISPFINDSRITAFGRRGFPSFESCILEPFMEDLCSIRWSVSAQQHPHLLLAPPLHLRENAQTQNPPNPLPGWFLFSFCKREALLENGREKRKIHYDLRQLGSSVPNALHLRCPLESACSRAAGS